MLCTECSKREREHDETTLCVSCDRDQWRDSTVLANKRFQYAENQLQRIHHEAGCFLVNRGLVSNYPCNYDELWGDFRRINRERGAA